MGQPAVIKPTLEIDSLFDGICSFLCRTQVREVDSMGPVEKISLSLSKARVGSRNGIGSGSSVENFFIDGMSTGRWTNPA